MAYNPSVAVNAIYNLKGEWDLANKAGDNKKKAAIASDAQIYYDDLKRNGRSDIADALSKSDYSTSKYIKDFYSKNATPEVVATENPTPEVVRPKSTVVDEENENLFKKYKSIYNRRRKINSC